MFENQEVSTSEKEKQIRLQQVDNFIYCPIPKEDMLQNLGLFINSKNLSRILFMDFIYRQILDVHGVVIEFGTRWGQNLALFSALRGIYEPFNRIRRIIGFDTFTGFPSVHDNDNKECSFVKPGGLSCGVDYEKYLEKIMQSQEQDNPIAHLKKYEIIKGDAIEEIDKYLKRVPETIIALVYFDFDIYEPTKKCLEAIKSRLVKGSIVAFDELCDSYSPGETVALDEVFGLNNIKLKRMSTVSRVSYFIYGE